MSYVDGTCPKHGRPLVLVQGVPQCITCNPAPREFPDLTVTEKDPGPEFFGETLNADMAKTAPERPAVSALSFDAVVREIISHFDRLPMPKDPKHVKAVYKAKGILQKIVETPNV